MALPQLVYLVYFVYLVCLVFFPIFITSDLLIFLASVRFLPMSSRELAAGGEDVFAAALPDDGRDAVVHEDFLEGLDGLGRGRLEGGAGKLVEEDQIELAAQVSEGPDEQLRVGGRVVHPGDEDVLEGDAPPLRHGVGLAGLDNGLDGVFPVDRHELVAPGIIGGIEGDGEIDRRILTEPLDCGGEAAGRQGDPSSRERKPVVRADDGDGFQDVVVVVQGLAHPHEDEVVDPGAFLGAELRLDDLVDDLRGAKVAREPRFCRKAEGAAHLAARLCGETKRPVARARDEDALDQKAVLEAKEDLLCRVFGGLRPDDFEIADPGPLFHVGPELLREVRHGLEGGSPLLVDPLHDLPGPELLPEFGHEGLDLLKGHVFKIALAISHKAKG
jgi:hypothetical protein